MGETFKKAMELAESASKTLSEASKDLASEIDKASKIVEDGVRAIERIANVGQEFCENLDKSMKDFQRDFHSVRDESDKLINQTRETLLQNVDSIETTIDGILEADHSSFDAGTVKSLLKNFDDTKSQTDSLIGNLMHIIQSALENAQQLIELAMNSSGQLGTSSEKTLTDARGKLERDFAEAGRIVEELGRHCLRDIGSINDGTAQHLTTIIDHLESMTKDTSSSSKDCKTYLQKEINDVKTSLVKNMDNVVLELNKSINQIQKQSEKALTDFKKYGEKTAVEQIKSEYAKVLDEARSIDNQIFYSSTTIKKTRKKSESLLKENQDLCEAIVRVTNSVADELRTTVKTELENAFLNAQKKTIEEANKDINKAIELAKTRSEVISVEGQKLSETIFELNQKFETELNQILEEKQATNVSELSLEDVGFLML
ncbi:hypothetical protein FQR65_LT17045 [Abscondita terminalis]|nr:hypothetical protein FQR65_LT17045 [Abscondita terminalis]